MTRIDKIKALCDAATKGPWKYIEDNHEPRATIWAISKNSLHKMIVVVMGGLHVDSHEQSKYNAALIAQSRTLVPELLELVQEMAGALEYAKVIIGHPDDAGNKPIYTALEKYKAWNEGE